MVSLVTGGAGFVGAHLVRLLRARGERVRVFDLAAPSHADDVQGSILDEKALAAAMEGAAHVFHLAGNAALWAADGRVFDEINHQGTKHVLAAAQKAGVRRFVHCSSLTTLVGKDTPRAPSTSDETRIWAPADMLGDYPASKLRAESAVMAADEAGLDTVIVLPTEPLGPGDEALTPPTRMILDLLNGDTPATIDCTLNFVPVQSLAEGMVAARDKGVRGGRYLLGGENVKMAELLKRLEAISGRAMPSMQLPYFVAYLAGLVDTKLIAPLTGKPPKAPLTGVKLAGRPVSFTSARAEAELDWRAAAMAPALAEVINWFNDEGLLKRPLDRPVSAES